MESPLKKRKVASQESRVSKVTSTPQKQSGNYREVSPAISCIGDHSSRDSSSIHKEESLSRRRLEFSPEKSAVVSDEIGLMDVLERSNSVTESVEGETEADILDYDEFFSKLVRFQKKGYTWNLYKPIGEEEGSLYHQILNNPRDAEAMANWFVSYFSNTSKHVGLYVIYKFFLDCAGYQKTDLKKYFTNPLPPISDLISTIMEKVDNEKCDAEVFSTGKFLFADRSRLGKILQKGIYNFVQKFVLEAHNQELLYGEKFLSLLKFLERMCKTSYRQLIYTGHIFMIKLLTAICIVKVNIPDSTLDNKQNMMLDNYINTLYVNFFKICSIRDNNYTTLKLDCIAELKMWMHYSAKVFVDHYNCVSVFGKLIVDEMKSVRLAVLETYQKMVQNDHLANYLAADRIENLLDHVYGRFFDVDINVALQAIEVYSAMITHYSKVIENRKKIFNDLIKNIYHKDYRMGSAACGCVIQIIKQHVSDDRSLLLDICKIAINFYPNLKPLLVESCMEHTNVLQNWKLIVEIFASPYCTDIAVELKVALSELFLESVHQIVTGLTSKVRQFSRRVTDVDLTHHKLIAGEIYPHLKAIMVLYRREPHIPKNILKIATKIKPEYLTKDHIESAEELNYLKRLFTFWTDTDVLNALVDYCVFVNEHIPRLRPAFKYFIDDLKKYISEELYKSFKTQDTHTLIIAKKSSIVFNKLDLNENIEWSKLLVSWDIIESNVEYLENMMNCCHWSLIWKIRKLSSAHFSKNEQKKEVATLSNMSKAYFSNCWELLGHQDQTIKFKAFERICESYIALCIELENISKQISALEDLKPSLKSEALQKQITDIFELSVGRCEDSVAQKYAMYIVNIAFSSILPMEHISIVFKYYDKCYSTYGKLIETVMSTILASNKNWMPMLVLNAICICLEQLLNKHGVVDIRSREAKDVLSLSRKFAECKVIKDPKLASQLLIYAINYAVGRPSYELLIFVRVFTDEIKSYTDRRKEILEHLKKKVPKSHTKSDPVLYLGEHLITAAVKPAKIAKTHNKTGRLPKGMKAPKLKVVATKVKKAPKVKEKDLPKKPSQSTESEISDDMTIHDTSSDDLDLSISHIKL